MAMNSMWIFVTFQKEGIHRWPDAENMPGVEFLAYPHRHMFHFEVQLQVFHDDCMVTVFLKLITKVVRCLLKI